MPAASKTSIVENLRNIVPVDMALAAVRLAGAMAFSLS